MTWRCVAAVLFVADHCVQRREVDDAALMLELHDLVSEHLPHRLDELQAPSQEQLAATEVPDGPFIEVIVDLDLARVLLL